MDEWFAPFDSKKYLVVKRGYLCLENARIDTHEFRRLIRKAYQQVANLEYWPAEITFSSAFSLWQGKFVPADFGVDAAVVYQDEMEQIYLDASQTFARLLAENNRHQQALKLLRKSLRYDPTNDGDCPPLLPTVPGAGQPGVGQPAPQAIQRSPVQREFLHAGDPGHPAGFPEGKPRDDWFSTE